MSSYKRTAIIILILSLMLTGCSPGYTRHRYDFFDTFDTLTTVTGYTQTKTEFDRFADIIHDEMKRLHRLFDIYNDYESINNLKYINDNAGVAPIKVDEDIIALLELAKTAYDTSGGAVNVALGSVLRIWSSYREKGLRNPQNARLPDIDELRAAAVHTKIDEIIIDNTASTVFLRDPYMSLDVGALAKGYALRSAMEIAIAAGFDSGIISSGGDIITVGTPMDGRTHWSVGIRGSDGDIYDIIQITGGMSVASSGNYERFFKVNDLAYGHIIDPQTLMPAQHFGAVSVLHPDSAIAEMLSTALFILPKDQGQALVELWNAEAIWIN